MSSNGFSEASSSSSVSSSPISSPLSSSVSSTSSSMVSSSFVESEQELKDKNNNEISKKNKVVNLAFVKKRSSLSERL